MPLVTNALRGIQPPEGFAICILQQKLQVGHAAGGLQRSDQSVAVGTVDVEVPRAQALQRSCPQAELQARMVVCIEHALVGQAHDDDGQGGKLQHAFELLLAAAQCLLCELELQKQAPREQIGQREHEHHDEEHEHQNDLGVLARGLAQRRGETVFQRRQRIVDRVQLEQELPRLFGWQRTCPNGRANALAHLRQGLNVMVRSGPDGDGLVDIGQLAKVPKQKHHAIDVVRVVAPLQKTVAGNIQIRVRLLQLDAGLPVAGVDGQCHQVGAVIGLVGVQGVAGQGVDGVLLPLGPQSLALHIGAHGRKQANAEVGQHKKAHHHAHKNPDHGKQPSALRDG
ncbi:MAG: hypothetical protein A3E00_02630 [Curvibacter sp. RIFCSPHIGHO2_12_FULL_63_18]|nr:MAG: hypothetical protein A3E00_02630 [Curvibacter sp. RIFCSPHIGHO2_12_FULL_63_18]